MALVATSDGRIVDVHDDLINQFQGLTPAPAAPPMLPTAAPPPPEAASGAQLQNFPGITPGPALPPALPSPAAPDVAGLADVQPPGPAATPQGSTPGPEPGMVAPAPGPAAAGTAPSPVGSASQIPAGPALFGEAPPAITQKQLAGMGEAGPLNLEIAARREEKAATDRLAAAQAGQATAMGAIETAANDAADRQLEQMRKTAEVNAKAVEDATAAYVQSAQRLANVRIDRSIDHPVILGIATALNILGTAMVHGDMTKVMDPIYAGIKAKVDAQLQDIEKGRADLGLQREAIAILRQNGGDKLDLQNRFMLAGLEGTKRRIDEYKLKSTSPIVRAQADELKAKIDHDIASNVGTAQGRLQQRQDAAAARAQAERLANAQMAVTIRGQNLQAAENDANRRERAQEHIDTIAKDLMMQGKASAAARAAAIKDGGIVDPVTKEYMLTTVGKEKMAQADRMEAQIRRDPTPVAKAYIAQIAGGDKAKADQLTEAIKDPKVAAQVAQQYADSIRQDAQVNDAAVVKGPIKPEEIEKEIATAHEVGLALDTAQRMLEQDPATWDRKAWAALQAQLMVANATYVKNLGERVSVKAVEAFTGVMGVDPDSLTSRAIDKGKALEAIKALKNANAQQADVALGKGGIKADWKPGVQREDAADFSGSTAQELARDATPGALRGAGFESMVASQRAIAEGGSPVSPQDLALQRANARVGSSGRTSDYGLDPAVDDTVRSLVKRAGGAGNKTYTSIVGTLARPLASGDRPGLDVGVARLIRDQDPKLLDAVLARVAGDAGQARADEVRRAIASPVPAIDLGGTPVAKPRGFVAPGAVVPEPVQ